MDIDVALTRAINGLAGTVPVLDFIMTWVSAIGVPALVLAVALQWWRGGDRNHRRHVLLAAGFSFLIGLFLNQVVLLLVQRPRPYVDGITHLIAAASADPSFPSDHATASVAIAAALLLHGMRRMGFWFAGFAVVVMLSRVYIGTHYVSDVLGGAVTGTIAALLVRAAYREGTRPDRVLTSIL